MKILVIGGLGVVGAPLVRELRDRGHETHVIGRQHSYQDNYTRCDIVLYRQLGEVFENHLFDYVYHLAAEFGRWNGEAHYDNLWKTNAIGTKNIIRWQEKLKFRMIFFSSSEVYGDFPGVMSEDVMDRFEIKQLNDYAISKWVNEMQIMNSAAMFNTETVRVRLFNTYGPGEYYTPFRSVVCRFIYHALRNEPYTVYLNHHRSSSYVGDTVATVANIVDNFIPGRVYNIGSTELHDIKTLSDIILEHVGIDDSLVTYKDAEPFTTKDKLPDVSRAIKELGHNPKTSLYDGLKETVDWMRAVYIDNAERRLEREHSREAISA